MQDRLAEVNKRLKGKESGFAEDRERMKKIESKETYDAGGEDLLPLVEFTAKKMLRDTRSISKPLHSNGEEHNLKPDTKLNWVVSITHNDPEFLCTKKVTKVFRRFGKLRGLTFDESTRAWTVEYAIEKEARKAALAAYNNKLFGFKLTFIPEYLLCTLEELIDDSIGGYSDTCRMSRYAYIQRTAE